MRSQSPICRTMLKKFSIFSLNMLCMIVDIWERFSWIKMIKTKKILSLARRRKSKSWTSMLSSRTLVCTTHLDLLKPIKGDKRSDWRRPRIRRRAIRRGKVQSLISLQWAPLLLWASMATPMLWLSLVPKKLFRPLYLWMTAQCLSLPCIASTLELSTLCSRWWDNSSSMCSSLLSLVKNNCLMGLFSI